MMPAVHSLFATDGFPSSILQNSSYAFWHFFDKANGINGWHSFLINGLSGWHQYHGINFKYTLVISKKYLTIWRPYVRHAGNPGNMGSRKTNDICNISLGKKLFFYCFFYFFCGLCKFCYIYSCSVPSSTLTFFTSVELTMKIKYCNIL